MNQSFKGLLTAGLRKSVVYAGRKMGKWWGAKVSQWISKVTRPRLIDAVYQTASQVAGSRGYSTVTSRVSPASPIFSESRQLNLV